MNTTINTQALANGFTLGSHPVSRRLQVITLDNALINVFAEQVSHWPVQALEYKPFLRFAVADILDKLTNNTLCLQLNDILRDRFSGAFFLDYEGDIALDGELKTELHIKLSTAIAHIVGLADVDAMFGHYYARFKVLNVDNSDSYLRQGDRRMELHNDGTYVAHRTDFVLMQKLAEKNMSGGQSLLLHIDDWQELDKFYNHPLAKQAFTWSAPKSKNVAEQICHPVFFEEDQQGRPHMLYIDQFAQPHNKAQARYLYEMGESLEAEPNYLKVELPVGAMLVIQNHRWLHGRDKFIAHPQLSRELLRQRGHFTED